MLDKIANKDVAQLSDGEKQRMFIARAVAQTTPLLLLDEPTAYLDYRQRKMVFKLLQQLMYREQKIILCSTHDISDELPVATHFMIINKSGEVQFSQNTINSAEEIYTLLGRD